MLLLLTTGSCADAEADEVFPYFAVHRAGRLQLGSVRAARAAWSVRRKRDRRRPQVCGVWLPRRQQLHLDFHAVRPPPHPRRLRSRSCSLSNFGNIFNVPDFQRNYQTNNRVLGAARVPACRAGSSFA
jgi:hypothetical protein